MFSSLQIPFLSLGSEIGKRIIRCQGTSLVSGEYIVEDIEIDSLNKFRRLFYLNTQSVIQSEAKLKNCELLCFILLFRIKINYLLIFNFRKATFL